MARIGPAPPRDNGKPPRRRCAPAPLLLLALALPGCETLDRMDYLDRFFEPQARQYAASEPRPAVAPAADWTPQPGSAFATEPPPPYATVADRGVQAPAPVVAMEPRPNPPTTAADAGAPPSRPRAAEPRPETLAGAGSAAPQAADPEARTRLLVRQNPWLTRFWMELTPAQQSRVERQLRRGDVALAVENSEPAAAWDSMGLADRAALVFGRGERPAPPDRRDGSIWARNS